jgi:hypothetical protein
VLQGIVARSGLKPFGEEVGGIENVVNHLPALSCGPAWPW